MKAVISSEEPANLIPLAEELESIGGVKLDVNGIYRDPLAG